MELDAETESPLSRVLSAEELDKLPPDIKKKLGEFFKEKFEEFLTSKALCETAKRSIDEIKEELEQQIQELKERNGDYTAKLSSSQQSVTELRDELDHTKEEIAKLHESVQKYENETSQYRRERNDAVDERDSLLKKVERRNIEVERLQTDVSTLEKQLQSAVTAKCEALAKLDEIQSKEINLDFKEKRMTQEKILLNNTIKNLTDDLNRTNSELSTIRRDQTVRILTLETKLTEKTEELKVANSMIAQISESNNGLTQKAEDLNSKLFNHSEEVIKIIDNYKKELQAKTKLADLYKDASEDSKNQIDELSNAIVELKKLINEATDQYGELETKLKQSELSHGQEIEDKNKEIEELKQELTHANDLIKEAHEESVERAVESLAPSAAASSRLIKSGMSLTEIYSVYVKTSEELQHEKKHNARLNLQLKSILQEIEEKAPMLSKQSVEYQHLVEANGDLVQQLESMITERVDARERKEYLERENKKLKMSQTDLSRQVCFLLKEIEHMRCGMSSDAEQSLSSDIPADELITKKLVTFSDIQEMQENNHRLLLAVRDLSEKLEEVEQGQIILQQENLKTEIERLLKRNKELEDDQEMQTKMMGTCMNQRDRYKKVYYEALKNAGNMNAINFEASSVNDDEDMEETPLASSSSISSNNEVAAKDNKKIIGLEEKLKDVTLQMKTIKEEYDTYRKDIMINEKMVNEQFDSMRNELRELTSTNCRLMSTADYCQEQIKILQKNVTTYKKQISALEERNRIYESTIIKHEQSILHLKDEAMSAQRKLAPYEVMVDNLKQEIRMLRDSESRLQMERDVFNRERQSQNLLLNNLEMIKSSFERSEAEGRIRIELRLDETNRECSALRRRLQEEQDRFRELAADLQRQTETAKQKLLDEKLQADKLREELQLSRNELIEKSKQSEHLSKKLQESLTPSLNDNPIAQANKRVREMELTYEQTKSDLAMAEKEIENLREQMKQLHSLAQSAEKELKEHHDNYTEEKCKLDQELARLRTLEAQNRSRIEELETEISLQITGAQLTSGDANTQLHKTQLELQEALQKLNDNNKELRELRMQNATLTTSLQSTEQKYANEMVLHSSDIQAMTLLKEQLGKVAQEANSIQADREKAIDELSVVKKGWHSMEEMLKNERLEMEERINNLNQQNTALHDQIQELSKKLSLNAVASLFGAETENTADKNESIEIRSETSFSNRSINEDDIKSSDQLLQIIKYLRKEKDIAVAKVDILKSETTRLQSEHSALQTKLEEALSELANDRSKSEVGVVTAAKHSELLRKIETLNAVTDSNRILREERNTLSTKLAELAERVTKYEDDLFPLQEKNRELQSKADSTASENASLRIEATRWRQRANALVERSNKNSPEDFKKLQADKEALTKLLSAEKESLKKSNEELLAIKMDKARLDNELQQLIKQHNTSTEENKKISDEFATLKLQNTRISQEIIELKNNVLNKEDELKKLNEELASKEAQLVDAKNKEVQIRKIAKRYKDSYFDLKKQEEEKESTSEDGTPGSSGSTIPKEDDRASLNEKIAELNLQIGVAQEENEKLKQENAALKANVERDERNKNLLKEAKTRIVAITDSRNICQRELSHAKVQLQAIEQTREEHEHIIYNIKSQFESRIARLESTYSEQDKEKQDTITRLTRENENLLMRINQLNRQLGSQQATKPSTSSSTAEKISTDSPRTANVKPMAGPSGQQSVTINPWRGSETPLASIRPMSVQNSRTAAVLPTSQTSNIASVQGSSSASVTALVPPQQQVHTTGNTPGEAMSSSPTSSHTDYMPATSSAAIIVAAVVAPMASTSAESSQEAESVPIPNNESTSSSSQVVVAGTQQQQAVALVSPRVEGTQQNLIPPQQSSAVQVQPEQNQAPSTSGTPSTPATISSHHQASSSNTVTTTQAGHKRPRDAEGDSSTGNSEESDKTQLVKRSRNQVGETFQGVSESGLEVEYQVPTSSQRDQEDDIIVVDSEDDDDGMADEGNAEADDGPFEDDADNGDGYEMEESYEQEQEMVNYDLIEGPDIDEDNVQSDNNEVEVDDSNEVPNQSGTTSSSHVTPDAGAEVPVVGQSSASISESISVASTQNQAEIQQIQTISSGSDAAGSSTAEAQQGWRQNSPHSRQTQASHLMLIQPGYEESGDDSIVPSTPTLYAPRRTDGFSEAVSSPHSQVPHTVRFTFSEPRSVPGPSSAVVPSDGGMDDTRIDLNELDELGVRSIPSTPQKNETVSAVDVDTGSSTDNQPDDAVAGPSRGGESSVPEITVTMAGDEDDLETADESATTSDVPEDERDKDLNESAEMDDGEVTDGVSSEGEKAPTVGEGLVVEEGREAEATQTPSSNTRSRSTRGTARRGGRQHSRGNSNRPTPIIWHESPNRGGRPLNLSPSRQAFQQQQQQQQNHQQRGNRARRMRRPSGPNFGNNMRY